MERRVQTYYVLMMCIKIKNTVQKNLQNLSPLCHLSEIMWKNYRYKSCSKTTHYYKKTFSLIQQT